MTSVVSDSFRVQQKSAPPRTPLGELTTPSDP